MFPAPKHVEFATKDDVVDYVSKGLFPPRKVYYDSVVNKLKDPDPVIDSSKRGKEVQIHEDVVPLCIREDMIDVLDRIYENRRRNVKKVIGGVTAVIAGITAGVVTKKVRDKKKAKKLEARLRALDDGEILVTEF